MIKRISTSELCVGMFIHDLDAKWMDHPFFSSRFLIQDEKSIRNYSRPCGISPAIAI